MTNAYAEYRKEDLDSTKQEILAGAVMGIALDDAMSANDTEFFNWLLCEQLLPDNDTNFWINHAIRKKKYDIAKILIKGYASGDGLSNLLIRLIYDKEIDLAKWLITSSNGLLKLDEEVPYKGTVLTIAINEGLYDLAKVLIESGASVSKGKILSKVFRDIHYQRCNADFAKWLLTTPKLDLDPKNADKEQCEEALHTAVSYGIIDVATLMVKAGIKFTGYIDDILVSKHPEFVLLLVDTDNINMDKIFAGLKDDIVKIAFNGGSYDKAQSLITHFNIATDLLHSEARNNNLRFVKWLLETNPNIDINHKQGANTALGRAMYMNNKKMFKLLYSQPGIEISPEFQQYHDQLQKSRGVKLAHAAGNDDPEFIVQSLVSQAKSDVINVEQLFQHYSELWEQNNPVIRDVLHVGALDLDGMLPTSCSFQGSADPTNWFAISGNYNPFSNIITIFNCEPDSIKLSTVIHEYSHRIMQKLFNNQQALPYPSNDSATQYLYEQATNQLLCNIVNQKLFEKMFEESEETCNHSNVEQFAETAANIHFHNKAMGSRISYWYYTRDYDDEAEKQQIWHKTQCIYNFSDSVLSIYKGYDINHRASEVIVRLPEMLVAQPECHEALSDIVAPLQEYWQSVITPAATKYIDQFYNDL